MRAGVPDIRLPVSPREIHTITYYRANDRLRAAAGRVRKVYNYRALVQNEALKYGKDALPCLLLIPTLLLDAVQVLISLFSCHVLALLHQNIQ